MKCLTYWANATLELHADSTADATTRSQFYSWNLIINHFASLSTPVVISDTEMVKMVGENSEFLYY